MAMAMSASLVPTGTPPRSRLLRILPRYRLGLGCARGGATRAGALGGARGGARGGATRAGNSNVSVGDSEWADELAILAEATSSGNSRGALKGSSDDDLSRSQQNTEVGSTFDEAKEFLRTRVGLKTDQECAVVWDVLTNPNSIFTRRVEQPRLSRSEKKKKKNSKRQAERAKMRAKMRSISIDKDMAPVVDYLCDEVGLKGVALANTIRAHPPVLAYDVGERIKPVIDYLVIDLECDNVAKLIAGRPSVLGFDLEALTRATDYLLSTDMDKNAVLNVVATTL